MTSSADRTVTIPEAIDSPDDEQLRAYLKQTGLEKEQQLAPRSGNLSDNDKFGSSLWIETKRRMRESGVTDVGIEWFEQARMAPARNVKGGRGNMRSEFWSSKMGMSIQTESFHIERVAALGLEYDPRVIGYLDQPPPLNAIYRKDGKAIGRRPRILDYVFVLHTGATWVIECKPENKLKEEFKKRPHLYARNAAGVPQYLPVLETLSEFGIHHRVVTPNDVDAKLVRNMELLRAFRDVGVAPTDTKRVQEVVRDRPRTIVEVAALAEVRVDTVLACISRGDVHVDLKRFPVAETEHTLVHSDCRWMSAYAELANCKPLVLRTAPRISSGIQLSWDGVSYRVMHRGECNTVLRRTDDQELVTLTNRETDELISKRTMSVETETHVEDQGAPISELLQQFCGSEGDKKGDRIMRQLEVVQQVDRSELTRKEAVKILGVQLRTVGNYLHAYRKAGSEPGDKFRSQIRYQRTPTKKSRTKRQACMDRSIEKIYFRMGCKTKPRPTKRAAFRQYRRQERKARRRPFSWTTYRTRLNELQGVATLTHRDGPRAGNSVRPSVGLMPGRLGDWPLHVVQFDVNVMDAIIRWYEQVLGTPPWPDRPNELIAVDGYSRAIVGSYIGFLNESSEMALLGVRDVVRWYHRIPDISMFDNGSGFISGALRRLLVGVCRREVAHRPPNDPRFSGQVERVFKTQQDQLFRNLAGYTGRLQARRMVTGNFNPRKDAIWGLDGLIRLCEAFFAIYNNTVHTELGQTPNQALEEGWKLRGLRTDQAWVYDEQFRRATMPVSKRPYVLDPKEGLKILDNRFRNPEVCEKFIGLPKEKRSFYLHFDPDNAAEVYARIDGEMQCFRSDLAPGLKALEVPGDRALVSKARRIEKSDARRAQREGNSRLDELVEAILEEQEARTRAFRADLASGTASASPDCRVANGVDSGGLSAEAAETGGGHVLSYLDKEPLHEGAAHDG